MKPFDSFLLRCAFLLQAAIGLLFLGGEGSTSLSAAERGRRFGLEDSRRTLLELTALEARLPRPSGILVLTGFPKAPPYELAFSGRPFRCLLALDPKLVRAAIAALPEEHAVVGKRFLESLEASKKLYSEDRFVEALRASRFLFVHGAPSPEAPPGFRFEFREATSGGKLFEVFAEPSLRTGGEASKGGR